MRWPICQATWLAPGTGRTSRSESDRSTRYLPRRNFVLPRPAWIAWVPFMLPPAKGKWLRRDSLLSYEPSGELPMLSLAMGIVPRGSGSLRNLLLSLQLLSSLPIITASTRYRPRSGVSSDGDQANPLRPDP